MVKFRRMMTRVTKMKVFLKNSFRYYAIARPLQYHMVITGGSFPLPALVELVNGLFHENPKPGKIWQTDFIKRLIPLGWQLIEDNLQISINAENSGHLNFPKYFDISLSNLQSQTFRFKLCTFFAINVPLFPFVYIHTFSIYCFVTFQSASPGETKVSFSSQSKWNIEKEAFSF